MIFEGSRYARTEVIPALDSRGEAVRVLDLRRIPSTPGVWSTWWSRASGSTSSRSALRRSAEILADPRRQSGGARIRSCSWAGPADQVPQNQAAP